MPNAEILRLERIIDGLTNGSQKSQIVDGDGNVVDIKQNPNTLNYEMLINLEGHECADNSTTTQLEADEVFTGTGWQDTLDYGVLSVDICTDQDSATDGLDIQWSNDGITISDHDYFSILANVPKTFTFGPAQRYYRIKYTNGSGGATTIFHLTSLLRRVYVKPSSHRINDAIVGEDDAELVKSVLTGYTPSGVFKNVQVTNAGNLKISLEEFENEVSIVLTGFTDNLDGEKALHTAAAMFGRVDDNTLAPIKVDASTQDIQAIEHEHAEIHGGDHYQICDYALNQSASAVFNFIVSVPDLAKLPHMTFEFSSTDGATLEVYEAPTGVSGGTTITPLNNDWNSVNTSNLTVTLNPTITTDGTRRLGFLAGGNRTAGFSSRSRENIWKRNTLFLFRISSLAVSNDIGYCAEWYEHTNKN